MVLAERMRNALPFVQSPISMRSLILLLLCITVAYAAPATSSPDPIVGKWRWDNKKVLTISANATLLTDDGHKGTWEAIPDRTAERKYRFVWKSGAFEDSMVLSKDLKSLSGKRTTGEKKSGVKLE